MRANFEEMFDNDGFIPMFSSWVAPYAESAWEVSVSAPPVYRAHNVPAARSQVCLRHYRERWLGLQTPEV